MAEYAKKTCNFCGIRDIQPNMLRVEKKYTSTIKNTPTGRDVLGSLLGSKISQRSLGKSLMSGGGRKITRTGEVWSCYPCQGRTHPEERRRKADLAEAELNETLAKIKSEREAGLIWKAQLKRHLKKYKRNKNIQSLEADLISIKNTKTGKLYGSAITSILDHFEIQRSELENLNFNKRKKLLTSGITKPESDVRSSWYYGLSGWVLLLLLVAYPLELIFPVKLIYGLDNSGITLAGGIFATLLAWTLILIGFHIVLAPFQSFLKNRFFKRNGGDPKDKIIQIESSLFDEYNQDLHGILNSIKTNLMKDEVFVSKLNHSTIKKSAQSDQLKSNQAIDDNNRPSDEVISDEDIDSLEE